MLIKDKKGVRKMTRNIMREAHKLTKQIISEYGDVDYTTQLGLCLSFLSQEGGKEMVELKGTEKQVKYANDIIEAMTNIIDEAIEIRISKLSDKWSKMEENKKAKYKTEENYKKTVVEKILNSKEKMFSNEESKFYIEKYRIVLRGKEYKYGIAQEIQDLISDEKELKQISITLEHLKREYI